MDAAPRTAPPASVSSLETLPLWPFALFYLGYFGCMGVFIPYSSLWWAQSGLNESWIALYNAIFRVTAVIAPIVWMAFIVRQGGCTRWGWTTLLLTAILSLCGMTFLHPVNDAWLLIVGLLLFGSALHAALPQGEHMALQRLSAVPDRYGHVRLWGSIGYAVMSWAAGFFLLPDLMHWIPWFALGVLLIAWFGSLRLQGVPFKPTPPPDLSTLTHRWWRHAPVWWMVGLHFLGQTAFTLYYIYFAWHLHDKGVSGATIGFLLGVAPLMEILVFFMLRHLFALMSPGWWILVVFLITVVRWWLTMAWPTWFGMMVLVQMTHALGFAVFHAATLRIVAKQPTPSIQPALGWINGLGYGGGGVLGSLLGGALWSTGRGEGVFQGALIITLLAAALAFYALQRRFFV